MQLAVGCGLFRLELFFLCIPQGLGGFCGIDKAGAPQGQGFYLGTDHRLHAAGIALSIGLGLRQSHQPLGGFHVGIGNRLAQLSPAVFQLGQFAHVVELQLLLLHRSGLVVRYRFLLLGLSLLLISDRLLLLVEHAELALLLQRQLGRLALDVQALLLNIEPLLLQAVDLA